MSIYFLLNKSIFISFLFIAITVLVVLEVLVTSVYYAQDHDLYPVGAIVKYGKGKKVELR